MVWTVNKKDDIARLIDMGVDGIISDRPDLLREIAGEKGHRLAASVSGLAVMARCGQCLAADGGVFAVAGTAALAWSRPLIRFTRAMSAKARSTSCKR